MLENFIQKAIRKWLAKMGWWSIRLRAVDPTGMPDLMNLKEGGQVWFIEVKRPGEQPSEIQKLRIAKLKAMGFRVDIMDSIP